MCILYTGYHGTGEIEHCLCAYKVEHGLSTYTVDNLLAKARALFLRTGAQTMLCLSYILSNDYAISWLNIARGMRRLS